MLPEAVTTHKISSNDEARKRRDALRQHEVLMRIIVGADHAGYKLKEALKDELRKLRHRVIDVGTHSTKPVDYPAYAERVGSAVLQERGRRGILVCGSGVGASVAANKIPGIRAGLCHDSYSAHQGVEHDDMNVLVLGGRVIGEELAKDLMRAFLGARFTGETRHRRRLNQVAALEKKYASEAGAKREKALR
jgi:RpiB/LacA/LacB family sugar-phosphate isomerase